MDVIECIPVSSTRADDRIQLLRFTDVADQLGISRSKLYELAGAGAIESVAIGRSRRIPSDAVQHFIDGLRDGKAQP